MLLTGTLAAEAVNAVLDTRDPADAVRRFQRQYPGVILESVDGHFVRGVCSCGCPVLEEDKGYGYDPETEQFTCAACATSSQPEEQS